MYWTPQLCIFSVSVDHCYKGFICFCNNRCILLICNLNHQHAKQQHYITYKSEYRKCHYCKSTKSRETTVITPLRNQLCFSFICLKNISVLTFARRTLMVCYCVAGLSEPITHCSLFCSQQGRCQTFGINKARS